jgi:hypothetical protein
MKSMIAVNVMMTSVGYDILGPISIVIVLSAILGDVFRFQVSAVQFRDCESRNLGIEGILPVESLRVERSF